MKKPNHSGNGQTRIIGGQWHGRKLPVPDSPGLCPTIDRVHEALFNWLAPVMVGAHCLDCLADSGVLRLEASSCYAANAILLEMDCTVSQQLQRNLATLEVSHTRVANTDMLILLAQAGTPHNVVFVGPPFRKGLLEETLTLLEAHGWLANGAHIYVESEVENDLSPAPMSQSLYHEKVAGQVAYHLHQRETRGEHGTD